jgi:HYR domain-containing protein
MLRFTGISASFRQFRAVSAGAFVLATIACSDNTSPAPGLQDGVNSVEIVVPDSLKAALSAQFAASLLNSSVKISANVLAPSFAPVASLSAACGSAGTFAGYEKSKVAFAPEAAPSIAPAPLFDDGYLEHVPIGFSFSFYGNAHNEVNIYSNGFIMFGPAVKSSTGFFMGDLIPFAANPNNIIALGWSDWSPQKVAGGIRYETRGQAPNRRFIVQFSGVPEFGGSGQLMSQLVLNEGSNDITIHTTTLSTTKIGQRITQGIENANGTQALFDSVQNVVTGVWAARVKNVFKLNNDAIRFSLIVSKDDQAPSITPAADVSVGNDPGLATAVVAVAAPAVSDNCSDVKVSSTRSDNALVDAPYPVGVTTITWTATDAAGNFASAAQKITVLDVEAPVFGGEGRSARAVAQSDVTVNATSPSGAVVSYDAAATDNVGVTSLSCEPASGSVFPVGSTTVNCSASDAAGNTSSKSFSVSVIGAREQLENLMEYMTALGLPNGTANPLINQLKSAYSEQGNECKKISDFIEMASKKSSDIDPDDLAYMTAEANRIRGAFGCAVGAPGRGR